MPSRTLALFLVLLIVAGCVALVDHRLDEIHPETVEILPRSVVDRLWTEIVSKAAPLRFVSTGAAFRFNSVRTNKCRRWIATDAIRSAFGGIACQ
jgi:hypothetical protein